MENYEICEKVKSFFGPMATRLKLEKAIVQNQYASYSISYPGLIYGLELRIDLMQFFIMPLVYICSKNAKKALPSHRIEFGGKPHKDYLARIADRLNLGLRGEFDKIKKLQGNILNLENICTGLMPLIESSWPTIESKPVEVILPE